MANIAYAALVIALVTAVYSALAFFIGADGRSPRTAASARNALVAVAGLVCLAELILLYAIFAHDFQFEYVASYTSLNTSPVYLLSALWAGNSGSLLFWAWLLSIFSLIATRRNIDTRRDFMPYASVVLMVTEAFFLLLIVAVASPFNVLLNIPVDGLGLNPMLENIGMVFHPPALLGGYVVFTIPFAFAIAALILRKSSGEWLIAARKWMLLAWLLLGVGNILGAWWAYVELGWGGYWAWDPVENAGLMPWLLATAFLHSSIMQRRKGIFRVWTMVLMILTFSMVIFGTFLTRSGIISSVHTFNDSSLGPYFTVFISIIFFGSLLLVYYRYDDLKGAREENSEESIISRESTFLLNNFLLVGATLVILVGTIFPAVSELFSGAKVSLAASFFNKVNGPLFLGIILLSGVCTIIGWRRATFVKLLKNSLWALIASAVLVIVLFITVTREPVAIIAFSLCIFVLLSILAEWFKDIRARHKATGDNYGLAWWDLLRFNAQRYGGYIVHIGIILMAVGVVGSSFYSVEQAVTLNRGDSVNVQRYTITYDGMDARETPDKQIVSARLSVSNAGKPLDNLVSEKYFHKSQQQPVTEVAIHTGPFEDLYIILEGWRDNGATADFKILVNPLVSWIWAGGVVFMLGGLVTFSPDQHSRTSEKLFSTDSIGSGESEE